jgi:hypothetical protein
VCGLGAFQSLNLLCVRSLMSKWWLKNFVMHGPKAQALLPMRLKLQAQHQWIAMMAPLCK